MEIINFTLESIPKLPEKSALCLGYFDGVHLAHQALVTAAKKTGLPVAVLTFSDDSSFVKKRRQEVLTKVNDRAKILEKLGVAYLLVVPFNEALMKVSPDQFISTMLNEFNIAFAVCGFDYTYGSKAAGKALDLKNSPLADFETIIVDEIKTATKEKVSTSLIKEKLRAGKISEANTLLGYPYGLNGVVVKGRGNGKKLGFPTANIKPSANYLIPKSGVFAATLEVDGLTYLGMGSIGTHPSIDEVEERVIEINLFDFNDDLYDKKVKINFLRYEREEVKFANVPLLIEQMKEDELIIRRDYEYLLLK